MSRFESWMGSPSGREHGALGVEQRRAGGEDRAREWRWTSRGSVSSKRWTPSRDNHLRSASETFGPHSLSRDGKKLALGGWQIVVLDLARQVADVAARSPRGNPMSFPLPGLRRTPTIAYVTSDSGAQHHRNGAHPGRQKRAGSTHWLGDEPRPKPVVGRLGGYIPRFSTVPAADLAWSEAWLYDFIGGESRRIFEGKPVT